MKRHKGMSSRYIREMARAPSSQATKEISVTRRETNITRKIVFGCIYLLVIILGIIAIKIILDTYGSVNGEESKTLFEYMNLLISFFK